MQNKEYIKNLIIRGFKGKLDQSEIQQIKTELTNYSREDLRALKNICKELAKEAINEQFDKEFNLPIEWKESLWELQHSTLNLLFALADEEIFYQGLLLEKQGGMDEKTKIIKILPTISQGINRIVARNSSNQINKSWKADESVTKKFKVVIKESQWLYFFARNNNEEETKQKISELVEIFESLTPEEIAVLKNKLKILANNLINEYSPSEIKNSLEIRQFINSWMNLTDVILDEKLLKDIFVILAKITKKAVQDEQIWKEQNPLVIIQKTGTEEEIKKIIKNLAQHFNKLAGEGEQSVPLSAEEGESIIQRLVGNNSNLQLNQEGTNLGDIWKSNLIISGLNSLGNSDKITQRGLQREFNYVFSNTQIKPKWYQNSWIVWPLVLLTLAIGGSVIWLSYFRKKKTT